MAHPERELLKATEVGELLGISRSSVYKLINAGTIPAIRIPGLVTLRISRKWCLENIDRLTAQAEERGPVMKYETPDPAMNALLERKLRRRAG